MAFIQAINLPYHTPALLAMAIAVVGIALVVARRRRTGGWAAAMLTAALLLIALAASGIRVATPGDDKVSILVDESASTRGATYRDEQALQSRIRDLVGRLPYEITRFTDSDGITELPSLGPGPSLLFSDGQYKLPEATGPIYAVLDPALESPNDARVVDIHPERGAAIAVLENTGAARQVQLDGQPIDLPTGRHRIALGPAAAPHTVVITGKDLWPENDQASSPGQPPDRLEPWNAGLATMPGFRAIALDDLPEDAGGYVPCAALALDAQLAGNLSAAQQTAVARYVQDLGGSLLLIGTNTEWTNLRGTALERLSPLSVDPPLPQSQWTVLLDASGSMAQNVGVVSKWQEALRAAEAMVRGVPERDRVRVGSFAQETIWWSAGPAGATRITPPTGLAPHGPTNLVSALSAAMQVGTESQRELLLLTDAEVEIPDVQGWAGRMKAAGMRVNCLILADGRGRGEIEALCRGTGGHIMVEPDPQRWAAASRQLTGQVAPARWVAETIQVKMAWPLPSATVPATGWNRSWLRQGASAAATAGEQTLAAWWRAGAGQVTALSWWPGESAVAAAVQNTQSQATSDTYQVDWPTAEPYVVRATSPKRTILRYAPFGHDARETAMSLSAPGRYEAHIPQGWRGGYATVLAGKDVVARRVLPAGYEPEYAHLGRNRQNLEALTSQTVGRLVEADEHGPLPIRLPMHWMDLSLACGIAALALMAAAVLLLRRRP